MGFEHRREAERFLADLRDRFARFGLALHPDKTRLIEFGRFAAQTRRTRGDGKPETFNFLGFTHACSWTRKKRFTVLRQTMRQRWQATLREVKTELPMTLTSAIETYVRLRQSLGAVFSVDARILAAFARAVGDVSVSTITPEMCTACCRSQGPPTRFWSRKHEALLTTLRI